MARASGLLGSWTLIAALALGCVGTKQRASSGTGGSSEEAGGTGGSHVGAGGSSSPTTGAGGAATDGPARVIGTDALGDAACATATQQAQEIPLDIYIMMDSSGSMADAISTTSTTTKWGAVASALGTFFNDPQSAGIGVGIQYFPLTEPGVPDSCPNDGACGNYGPCAFIYTCSSPASGKVTACNTNADCVGQGTCVQLGECGPAASPQACVPVGGSCTINRVSYSCAVVPGYCDARDICDDTGYATPAVPVAALNGAATTLLASINGKMPDGLTPTSAALSGAITYAQTHARANPTHKVVVLLATDGLPDECTPYDIAGVAGIAAAGLAATPSIATYVIGVFSPDEMSVAQPNLDMIAGAGGTKQAYVVQTGSTNVSQSFVSALNAVRSKGLACQYAVPTLTGDGGQLDYSKVNVVYTAGSGQKVTIGNVKDQASCSATQGGWYYDVDPATGATPQTISVCSSTCAQMQADPAGRVDVLLGCATIILVG